MADLMDMDFEGFKALVEEIKSQGYDEATAARYAGLVGDTPCVDQHGNILVMEGTRWSRR